MSDEFPMLQVKTGEGIVAEEEHDATVIDATAGKVLRVMKGHVSVSLPAVNGGGLVSLEDGVGGTVIFQVDADAVGGYDFDFSPRGFPLTVGALLNLTVNGAIGDQASARCTVTAYLS